MNTLTNVFSLAIILLASFLVVGALTPYGAATSSDSLSYLDMAANIRHGKGALATDFSLENAGANSFKDQRSWPPLYPALLSVVVNEYSDAFAAANISKLLLFISSCFLFLILSSRIVWYIALLLSLFFMMSLPIIIVYTYAWSETLFICLLMILMWSSIKYLSSEELSNICKILYVCTILISSIMLAYTRYIGISFILLYPFIYAIRSRTRFDRISLFIATGIYLIVVGYMLLDNYLVAKSISGAHRALSDKLLVDILYDIYHVIMSYLPSSRYLILSSLVSAVIVVVIIEKTNFKIYSKMPITAYSRYCIYISVIIALVYIFSIVLLRWYSDFDRIDIRLLAPIFPSIFIILAVSPSYFTHANIKMKFVSIICFFLILAFVANGYSRFLTSLDNWAKYNSPKHLSGLRLVYNNFTKDDRSNQERKLLSGLVKSGGVIVVDEPLICRFLTKIRCVQRPKHLDMDILHRINSLPNGSILIINKDEIDNVFSSNISIKYIDMGGSIAIQLPLKVD